MNKQPSGFLATFLCFLPVIGVPAFASFLIGSAGGTARYKAIQVEAVEHGYAEWVPDNKGEVKFTWKGTQ